MIYFNELKSRISDLERYLDIEGKSKRLVKEEAKMFSSSFWENTDDVAKVNREITLLRNVINKFKDIQSQFTDIEIMIELEEDEKSIEKAIDKLMAIVDREEEAKLMNGEYDKNSAVIHIHSGAGGKDASSWAKMLERMYVRWAEIEGYELKVIDRLEDEGGIKQSTMLVDGTYAFGKASCERGIHRLVRISPFDSNSRRHTSFAAVSVSPVVEDFAFELDPKDLRVETFRSSGAGGQHVNTTDSAVRITHTLTGISASCSSGRSQIKNRDQAMKILKSRILEIELEKRDAKLKKASGEERSISWGNQIRSYVFHPYRLVKDHRTKLESSDVDSILDGNISNFITSFLKFKVSNLV